MKNVAVLGAGSWGTALSIVLADNGHNVRLWSYRKEQVDEINVTRQNKRYLDVVLPDSIQAYHDIEEAVAGAEAIVIVVPSKAMREVMRKLAPFVSDQLVVHASKESSRIVKTHFGSDRGRNRTARPERDRRIVGTEPRRKWRSARRRP